MPNITVAERLREAAFALFSEQGYDATSVDQIAERAGVGRSTFFRAYPTKEAVIFPDHEEVLARIEARLAAAAPGQHFLAIREAARLVLRHYLDEGEHARARYRLTRSVPALREREIARMQRYQETSGIHPRLWTPRTRRVPSTSVPSCSPPRSWPRTTTCCAAGCGARPTPPRPSSTRPWPWSPRSTRPTPTTPARPCSWSGAAATPTRSRPPYDARSAE